MDKKSHIVALDSMELGAHVFDFQLDNAYFSEIENSELLGGEVKVEAHLNLREYDFDLDIAVKGLVQVTCDRCLDEMDVAINAEENEWEWDEEYPDVKKLTVKLENAKKAEIIITLEPITQ